MKILGVLVTHRATDKSYGFHENCSGRFIDEVSAAMGVSSISDDFPLQVSQPLFDDFVCAYCKGEVKA